MACGHLFACAHTYPEGVYKHSVFPWWDDGGGLLRLAKPNKNFKRNFVQKLFYSWLDLFLSSVVPTFDTLLIHMLVTKSR